MLKNGDRTTEPRSLNCPKVPPPSFKVALSMTWEHLKVLTRFYRSWSRSANQIRPTTGIDNFAFVEHSELWSWSAAEVVEPFFCKTSDSFFAVTL